MAVASLTIAKADPSSVDYAIEKYDSSAVYHHILQFRLNEQCGKSFTFFHVICNGRPAAEGINTVLDHENRYVLFSCDDDRPRADWHWETK